MRGFFKKLRERQGPKGKNAFLLPFPSLGNRGAARGCRQWPSPAACASGAAGRRGKDREGLKGVDSPLDFGEGGPQGGNPWRRAAAGGGGHGGAAVGIDGGQGEEGE